MFASVDVTGGVVIRWIDHWGSRAFDDAGYASLHEGRTDWPTRLDTHRRRSLAAGPMTRAAQAVHATLTNGAKDDLRTLLHPDVVFEDTALGIARRGVASVVDYLTSAGTLPPFGDGADLQHIVGGTHGGGYEWRAANGRFGFLGVAIDDRGKVLRLLACYDHRAFA